MTKSTASKTTAASSTSAVLAASPTAKALLAAEKAGKPTKALLAKLNAELAAAGKMPKGMARMAAQGAAEDVAKKAAAEKASKAAPAPKSADVKCAGCAKALLSGGKCDAHGDPKKAHAAGVAATGKERTLKGKTTTPSAAAVGKVLDGVAGELKAALEGKAAPAAAKPTKAPKADGKPNPILAKVITLLKEGNQRREGTAAHTRFSFYKTGMTVAQYLEAGKAAKVTLGNVHCDVERGNIALK